MANAAPFDSMRYFLSCLHKSEERFFTAKVKDLRQGLSHSGKDDREFLHKYMTLTRCDLLFADKAILVEGTTERILLPKIIEKIDKRDTADKPLSSQYISILEVGGAYAHLFFDLLDFLELKALVITDLDTIKDAKNPGRRIWSACKVSEGTRTSNACIKSWFSDESIEPSKLIQKTVQDRAKGIRFLSFQVPEKEGQACGRSFEDAFILANQEMFSVSHGSVKNQEAEAWEKAQSFKNKKSDFALKYAIEETEWKIPRYIHEGLIWLREDVNSFIYSSTLPAELVALKEAGKDSDLSVA